MDTLELLAGKSSTGSPVYEKVIVTQLQNGNYQLLASPGMVLGLAANDIFRLNKEEYGAFVIVDRGRNVCIQIFKQYDIDAVESYVTPLIVELDGKLDGKSKKQLVYTVLVDKGFGTIEAILNHSVAKFPDMEWLYGNVYDPTDGVTPLNWW